MTAPAVQPPPRERAPAQYQELNEQRYRQQVDEELAQKHDKRSNLRLGRGKSLVLSSPDGLEYAIALDDEGFITVTNYSTGDVGELTVRFDNVEGLAQEFIDVRAEFAAADGSLSSAYIAADAIVAADAASANASLSTTLTAAYQAADSTVASNAAALVATEASTRASADTAIASDVTALTARVTTAEGDINTVEATAAAIDGRLVTVEGSYATASSVSSLTATVNTKARTFSQTSAPTATATGDLWIDTDDNNKLYRWSGSAWVAADDARIATNAAAITTESTARASGDSANATSITNLTAAVSSIRAQALPTRPAIATDFTSSASGSVTSAADLTAGTVVAVANEGDVRQFTAGANIRHKGYLPVVSGRTYRVRGRVRTTVDGTDNRGQVGFRYLDSSYNSAGFDAGSVDNTFTVADGWLTLEYTRTGAQILAAAATSAYVSSRVAVGVNAGGTSSGATTQVAWVELEDITDFTTNAAAITTESSARASGDSANATSITNLTASVSKTTKQLIVDNFDNDGHFWTTAFGGAPESVADPLNFSYVAVTNIGRVAEFSTFARYLTPKAAIKPYVGMKLRVEARVRATVDPSSGAITAAITTANGLSSAWAHGSPSITLSAVTGYSHQDTALTVADGWVTIARFLTCSAVSTFDAGWRPRLDFTHTGSGGTVQVAYFRIEDVTEMAVQDAVLSASITTESSARASGDSANATLITNLTAEVVSLRTQVLPDRPAIASDFTGSLSSGTPSSIAALATGTIVNVANEGDVRQFTDNTALAQRGWLPVVSGNTYRCQFRARVTVDGTGNQLFAQFVLFNAAGTVLASFGNTTVDASFVAADGWVNGEITGTGAAMLAAQATAAFVRARVYGGRNSGGTHSGATWQVAYHRLEDITEIEALEASVTTTASAVADIEGRLAASYAIQVDGGGNGALVSLEDGTTLGSVVKLAADRIELAAEAINLGSGTVFENTNNTIHTTASGYRYRDRGPFGASGDLLVWYGPTSVSLNSETKTNGVFSMATDGIVRYGSAELLTVGTTSTRAKALSTGSLSFSANSTWQVAASVDVSDVASGSFIQMPFVSVGGVSLTGTAGTGYEWRLAEAPVSSPSTKTVIKSGTFVVTAGGFGDPPEISDLTAPSTSLVAATNSGSVRYSIEIQKATGAGTVELSVAANFIVTPG